MHKIPLYFEAVNEGDSFRRLNGFTYELSDEIYEDGQNCFGFLPFTELDLPEGESYKSVGLDYGDTFYYPLYLNYVLANDNNFNYLSKLTIPVEIVDRIKSKKCKILITNQFEGFEFNDIDNKVSKSILQKYGLIWDDVVYFTGNIKGSLRAFHIYYNFWEDIYDFYVRGNNINLLKKAKKTVFSKSLRPCKLICLQRRPKSQRLALFTSLYESRIPAILSMGTGDFGRPHEEFQEILNIFSQKYPREFCIFKKHKLEEKLPFLYDTELAINNPTHDLDIEKYYKAYLHIVSETYFEYKGQQLFYSEKIYKPVLFFQPFVLFSQPGSLEYFRSLGFQTFGDFIDESYDSIRNDTERFQAAYRSATCFVDKPPNELDNIMKKMWPILEHNYNTLTKRRDTCSEKLIKDLWKYLLR